MRKGLICCVIAICCYACTSSNENQEQKPNNYFDVLGFFNGEITKLNKLQPIVYKTVNENGNIESKQLKIKDWKREFKLFLAADINKAAWRSAFKVVTKDSLTTYTSTDEKIPIKKLSILRLNNKVVAIEVVNKNFNILYKATDTLTYYTDSLYRIKKTQNIKLLSPKTYEITGKFNP